MTPPVDPAEERDDLDDKYEVEQPVPIACQWGMPAWCSSGRHHRCYFTTNAADIKAGAYGHHHGHVWICPCPCHANQGYRPCPHPDHDYQKGTGINPAPISEQPVQINLF